MWLVSHGVRQYSCLRYTNKYVMQSLYVLWYFLAFLPAPATQQLTHAYSWLYIIHRREAAENAQLDTKINANDNNVGKGKADAVGTGLVGCDNQVFVISDEMNERI